MTQINKKKFQDYINRWQLVKEVEDREIQDASLNLLFKQTLSIWDISKSLGFINYKETTDPTWADLQKTWIKSNEGK